MPNSMTPRFNIARDFSYNYSTFLPSKKGIPVDNDKIEETVE